MAPCHQLAFCSTTGWKWAEKRTKIVVQKDILLIWMTNKAKILNTFFKKKKMLLQPLIYWLLNHWAQCKSYNQHLLLTLIIVCGSFIAKLVFAGNFAVVIREIIQLFLSILSSSISTGWRGATVQQPPCDLVRGPSHQWTFLPPPLLHRCHTTPTSRLAWHNAQQIPFIIAQEFCLSPAVAQKKVRRCFLVGDT